MKTSLIAKWFAILAFVLLGIPAVVGAAQMEADSMCLPYVKQECGCGMEMKGTPPKCQGSPNKFLCPCSDSTNGFTTSGKCVATFKCQASGTSDGKMDPGMAKLGEMLGKLMEALMKQQGGGGSGGETPTTPGQQCTTLQPTQDQSLVAMYPGCYYYQAPINPIDPNATTTPTLTDPSGGLVAAPMTGEAPLAVMFSYNNGPSGCGTPALHIEFGDGYTENLPSHTGDDCTAIEETISHTFAFDGSYIVRLKNSTTQAIKGGVTVVVGQPSATGTAPVPDTTTGGTNDNGTNTNATGTNGRPTGNQTGNNTNIGSTLFNTPLNNLNNSGNVNGTTGGNSTGGSASTGGNNGNNSSDGGAALNFNTPQSIVQSIISKTLQPGAYGDVKILENGTTIIAGVRNSNSEVAGFFGLSGKNTQGSVTTVQRLCTARPWATNFLSFVIPPTFFDSLCTWRGYAVGRPAATPPATTNTTTTKTLPTTNTKAQPKGATTTPPVGTTTPNAPKPRVDIWASPATVPLGARTSIFWSTQNVQSCIETSPDGGFSHNSLQGGASTVPLTTPTTYTISCTGTDGKPYTDNVTVLIAI